MKIIMVKITNFFFIIHKIFHFVKKNRSTKKQGIFINVKMEKIQLRKFTKMYCNSKENVL